jgi:hypothetical protein
LVALARLATIGYTIVMISSIRKSKPQRKKIGRPRVGSAKIMVAVPPDLLKELDTFRFGLAEKPGRPEAIRHLMVQALSASKKKGR